MLCLLSTVRAHWLEAGYAIETANATVAELPSAF